MNSGTLSKTTTTISASSPFAIADLAMMEQLFDHVPETAFFLKDVSGRYLAVNRSLLERCGMDEKRELIGKSVHDIFPTELAKRFAAQDHRVLRTGTPVIERLELHWYVKRREGWCLTTKLPVKDASGRTLGLIGISRDIRTPGDAESIPATLVDTLDYLENHFDEEISPSSLAKRAGLTPVRFARLIKRIFRLTPGQLITQTRLAAASRMLRESGRSVAEIAHNCGFYDHSAFTRAFRSATGLTPSSYRGEFHREA